METQLIQLKSLPNVALVRMPGIYHDPFMWTPNVIGASFKYQDASNKITVLTHPEGTWRIVSTLAEISEEQAAGMVEWNEVLQYYPDYSIDGLWNGDITALESFHSAIKADGWYLENPYGATAPNGVLEGDFNKYLDWADAQQRVLDPDRTLVIERK